MVFVAFGRRYNLSVSLYLSLPIIANDFRQRLPESVIHYSRYAVDHNVLFAYGTVTCSQRQKDYYKNSQVVRWFLHSTCCCRCFETDKTNKRVFVIHNENPFPILDSWGRHMAFCVIFAKKYYSDRALFNFSRCKPFLLIVYTVRRLLELKMVCACIFFLTKVDPNCLLHFSEKGSSSLRCE